MACQRRTTTGMAKRIREDDRGVSDLVAYTLMFSIILAGVSIVSLGVPDVLGDLSDREKIENSERSLTSAAATLDEIHRQGATQRSFNLPLNEGTVFLNDSTITVSSPDEPDLNETYNVTSLEHQFDRSPADVTVAYEAGAVFRSSGVGARYQPSLRCDSDTAIISIVRLTPDNVFISEGGGGPAPLDPSTVPSRAPFFDFGRTLIFSATVENVERSRVTFQGGGAIQVNVSESPNREQWNDYFERTGDGWEREGENIWACNDVDDGLIRVVTVGLEIR